MLVLTRKVGERVMIGPNIAVTVTEVRGDRVKLAFEAPDQVPIYREEIFRRIQADEPTRGQQQQQPGASSYYAEFA